MVCPLALLAHPEQIVGALGEAIEGFQFSPGSEPQQQLLNYLKRKQILLVLDNYEHLLGGAPLVSAILSAAPRVQVLATSRKRLNLHGETIYSLGGMLFPDRRTPQAALECDAGRLFLGAAQRLRPEFQIVAADLTHLACICRLVAGMPLGLILAAAWVDMLSLEQIAEDIQRGLDILKTETRDVSERQRSIRAVFEPTWGRLSAVERAAFMRLTVFRSGFTDKATERVVGADRQTLRRLFDRALVVRGADGRYHIHQLLRQYGEEKLRTSPEAYAAAREAHLAYYAAFAARRADELRGNKFYEAIAALGVELDNLLVTWEWACEHPQHHEVLWDFVFCFNWFFWEENRWHEGLLIPLAAIPVVEHSGAPAILAYLVTWYGALMCATFCEGGEETLRRGVALLDGLADADLRRELADLMVMAGWTHGGLQNFDELRHLSQRAIAIAREYQWEWETAFAVLLYAAAYFNNWFTDSELEVRLLLKEITDIAQAIGNMWLLNACGLLLGSLEQQEGNLVEAKRLYLKSFPI